MIPQNAKVKAAMRGHRRRRLALCGGSAPARPRWLRPPSSPAAAQAAAPTADPPSCAWSYAAPGTRRPGRAVHWAEASAPTRHDLDTVAARRSRHSRARHQMPQRRSGLGPAPQDDRPTAPGSRGLLRRSPVGPPDRGATTRRAAQNSGPHGAEPASAGPGPVRQAFCRSRRQNRARHHRSGHSASCAGRSSNARRSATAQPNPKRPTSFATAPNPDDYERPTSRPPGTTAQLNHPAPTADRPSPSADSG